MTPSLSNWWPQNRPDRMLWEYAKIRFVQARTCTTFRCCKMLTMASHGATIGRSTDGSRWAETHQKTCNYATFSGITCLPDRQHQSRKRT